MGFLREIRNGTLEGKKWSTQGMDEIGYLREEGWGIKHRERKKRSSREWRK